MADREKRPAQQDKNQTEKEKKRKGFTFSIDLDDWSKSVNRWEKKAEEWTKKADKALGNLDKAFEDIEVKFDSALERRDKRDKDGPPPGKPSRNRPDRGPQSRPKPSRRRPKVAKVKVEPTETPKRKAQKDPGPKRGVGVGIEREGTTSKDKKGMMDTFVEYTSYFESFEKFLSLFRFNITFKMALSYTLLFLQIMIIFNLFILGGIKYGLYVNATEDLRNATNTVVAMAEIPKTDERDFMLKMIRSTDMEMTVYLPDQSPVASSLDEVPAWVPAGDRPVFNVLQYAFPDRIYKQSWFRYNEKDYILLASIGMERAQQDLDRVMIVSLAFSLILVWIASRKSSRVAYKHLKSIYSMTKNVKEISAGKLDTRLNVRGTKDELKDLAHTFNGMMDRIQDAYDRQRQFVSDASHELRTPIAVIQGYAGMLNRWGKSDPEILEESIDAIQGESQSMQSLVESLLFIARNDKGALQMEMGDFDLADLICEVSKETRLIDADHEIVCDAPDTLTYYGSGEKLKQAIRVFIDNAIKYTPDKGKITLRLKATSKHAMISIEDNGIGISKDDLPHIFDRFYRADKSRTKLARDQKAGGTGLGLAIAQIIIASHHGNIHVDSELNQGTKITILLPIDVKRPQGKKSQEADQ